MMAYADKHYSGLITDFNQLSSVPGVNPGIMNTLKQECYLSPYHVVKVQMVGPKVGAELRKKAILATLYALAGMLAYIAFRFEWIYGLGAVIACFHDTLITIGLFSIFNEQISMTVIAALLTLVGYSMNDTIVIFDRIRENLKISRREPLEQVMNRAREPDVKPDGDDIGSDVSDGDRAVSFRRSGVAWFFVRVGLWNYCRNVFFGVHRQPDRVVLA